MAETILVKLPDPGGAFVQENLDAVNKVVTDQNANNTSLRAAINAIVAGGFTASDSIIAHAGGTQAAAIPLTSVVNRVATVATAADSVLLPPAVAGLFCVVINDAAKSLQAYGAGTDTINDVATATGVPVAATTMAIFLCTTAGPGGKWYSIDQWNAQFVNVLLSAILDTNGKVALAFTATATAVNGVTIINSATGDGTNNLVQITATGSDAAVGLAFVPKGAAGVTSIGLSTGTGDVVVGSSSGAQSVKIANGSGAPTVNIANVSTAGATIAVAGAATANAVTDTLNIATGNAAGTGKKVVNIATGVPNTAGNNQVLIGGSVANSAVSVKAAFTSYQGVNYVAASAGASNALVATLNDANGNAITVAAGLTIILQANQTLQAGANTLNLNGHGTDAIKKASNAATDLGAVTAATAILLLTFNGTVWMLHGT